MRRGVGNSEREALMEKRDRDAVVEKLKIAIEHSLFIDEKRKKIWLNALDVLQKKEAQRLLEAILRENIRYKKGIRKLKFKKIPERNSEEASGDI
jgi:hypothetical protein